MPKKVSEKKENLSDNELVKAIRKGQHEKYGELTERYKGRLFAYLYRFVGQKEEAEDLLQDVFIKAFKNLRSYDSRRKFSSWIYRIAHNEAINYVKRKSLKRFISWENVTLSKDLLSTSGPGEGAEDAWIRKEANTEVEKALDKLSPKYKQVLVFRYYFDQTYEEMSEVIGKPVNTVGTLINRAKKKLIFELSKSKNMDVKKKKK